MQQLIEQAPFGLAILRGPNLRYELVNAHFRMIADRPEEDFIGREFGSLLPQLKSDGSEHFVRKAMQTGERQYLRKRRICVAGKGCIDWDIDIVPLRSVEGQWPGVLIVMREEAQGGADLLARGSMEKAQEMQSQLQHAFAGSARDLRHTVDILQEEVLARISAERKLRRANLCLRLTSECNQAMVKATSEEQLLEQICNRIIEVGGYSLAWAGFIDQQEPRSLRPVAHCGQGGEHLGAINLSPAVAESVTCPAAACARSGTSAIGVVHPLPLSSGSEPCRCTALPLKEADGGTFGVLCISTVGDDGFSDWEIKLFQEVADDLAYGIMGLRARRQRVQAQRALQESNELLERVFSTTNMLIAYMDREFNFVRVNRSFAQADGRPESSFVGRNHFEFYPCHQIRTVFESVLRTGETEAFYEQPFPYQRGMGGWWNWKVIPVKDAEDKVTGVILSILDVTEQRRARETLHETERIAQQAKLQLATLVESSNDAIISVDLEGVILSWNQGAQRIWGFNRQEIIGKALSTLLTPARIGQMQEVLRRVAAGEHHSPFDTAGLCKRMRRIEISMNVSAIGDDKGRIVGISVIGRDITEYRRLEKEVLRVGEMERQRIGYDLHEMLGQNLTGMAFMSKVLEQQLEGKQLPEARYAHEIARLLNESTTLTRSLARGLAPVHLKAEGLPSALKQLTEDTELHCGIPCLFHYEQPVAVDDVTVANHLYRIAQEAVTNAVRHAKASRIELSLMQEEGPALTLIVKDDGIGIPRDMQKNKGMGLRIMSYRSNSIRALLTIRHGVENGTIIKCSVPLDHLRSEHGEING